jgi:hypothetical protein
MAKAPSSTAANAAVAERPRALDVLTNIAEQAIDLRYADRRVTLVDVGRAVIAASRVLHIRDLDERISVENAAVIQIAKKRQLVS